MKASLFLKLFALASLAATAAAVLVWRETGASPPTWLLQVSLATFLAAMLVGLIGVETRPRSMLRFLAAIAALVSAVSLVSDMTHEKGGFTSLHGHLSQFVPSLVASVSERLTQKLGPAAWDPVATTLLSIPTFLLFAIFAGLCGFASRRREKLQIFVN